MAFSINGSEPIALPVDPIRCHRCGLPVAAWRVDRDGLTYCTSFCAKSATGDVVGEAGACAPLASAPTTELDGIVAKLWNTIRVLISPEVHGLPAHNDEGDGVPYLCHDLFNDRKAQIAVEHYL